MPKRFAFRQVQLNDIEVFLSDGEIRSHNHPNPQHCHRCSIPGIVDRRSDLKFPDKSCVNDYVPFYFSPVTAYNFTICRGNVDIIPPPPGFSLGYNYSGKSAPRLRIFFVCAVENFQGHTIKISNTALNTTAHNPRCSSNLDEIESLVPWKLFDEPPLIAEIPEIGYKGAHSWFNNIPEHTDADYHARKSHTMAELLVKDSVPMSLIRCVVANPKAPDVVKKYLEASVRDYKYSFPVIYNADFFFDSALHCS